MKEFENAKAGDVKLALCDLSNFKLKLDFFPILERWNLKSEELN